jgi:hypothetical protein
MMTEKKKYNKSQKMDNQRRHKNLAQAWRKISIQLLSPQSTCLPTVHCKLIKLLYSKISFEDEE